jgi:hypothetical protein
MVIVLLGCLLGILLLALREKADGQSVSARHRPIALRSLDSFNLVVLRHHSAAGVDVAPSTPLHQWFAGVFEHVPTNADTVIRLCMAGHDRGVHVADCAKWVGLRPMLTYADPLLYETYVWYRRDGQGCWRSCDPCGTEAGHGVLPEQGIIPPALAGAFLSADGTLWGPWQEMGEGEADPAARTFTLRYRFVRPRATVAMHVPFTYTYAQEWYTRLQAHQASGVSVDVIGRTAQGRKLQVIRVDDPTHPTPLRLQDAVTRQDGDRVPVVRIADPPGTRLPRVLLVIAREHGTEHTPGWVIRGMVHKLLDGSPESARLRRDTTWLFIPMFDPDAVAQSRFHVLTSRFFPHQNHPAYGCDTPPEIIAYARYLRAFINSGRVMPVVTSFYGLECNEGLPVLTPFRIPQEAKVNTAINSGWYRRLRAQGILTAPPEMSWFEGWAPYRVNGWCGYWYGALPLTYEINDRYPACRLIPPQLEQMGEEYLAALVEFLETPAGCARRQQTEAFLQQRRVERDLWFRTSMAGTSDDPTLYDMLALGY